MPGPYTAVARVVPPAPLVCGEVLVAPLRPRPAHERYRDALCVLIAREGDELERYLLRVKLLKAIHVPHQR